MSDASKRNSDGKELGTAKELANLKDNGVEGRGRRDEQKKKMIIAWLVKC